MQIDEARKLKDTALYKYALGDQKTSLKDILQALQLYSTACENVNSANNKSAAVAEMSRTYELATRMKKKENVLSHQEKLLYVGSRISNFYFPWVDDPIVDEFEKYEFTDLDGELELSTKQQDLFHKWERPGIAICNNINYWFGIDSVLYQDSLQDCSVVASLLSLLNWELRTDQTLFKTRVYPWKPSNGKYHIKLHFNGTDRRVIIDDLLPTSKTERNLFVRSKNNLLWPALLEKAYMKVMGGYNFAGSHACIDTFYFSGWIPVYIHLSSPSQDPTATLKDLWNSMYKSWEEGNLVACIGTGQDAREEMRLIPVHDYTIIDMKEENDERLILVRNPWKDQSGVPTFSLEDHDIGHGSFWMDYDTVRMHFESLYLNYNPQMFEYKQMLEFTWSLKSMSKPTVYTETPQFVISNDSSTNEGADIMIHVTRYIGPKFDGYMNLVIYDTSHRMVIPHNAPVILDSPAVNTSYITTRVTIPPKKTYLIVLKAQDAKSNQNLIQYSLNAFSHQPITLKKAKDCYLTKKSVDSRWDTETAGGSWALPSYSKNPQFKLTITKPTPAGIYAFSDTNLPLNVQLFWSRGKPIRGCCTKDVLCSSGQYVIGACSAELKKIDPGEYTAVVSTYRPGYGSFQLLVASNDEQSSIEPIKPEFASKFCRSISDGWDGRYRRDIPLKVNRQTDAVFHLYTLQIAKEATYRPNLRVSVYEGVNLVASTENFNDQIFGVYLDSVTLKKDREYVVTLERMEAGYGMYQLDVFSSDPVVF